MTDFDGKDNYNLRVIDVNKWITQNMLKIYYRQESLPYQIDNDVIPISKLRIVT
jgi:hypothetical protein